jgi:hypothetical protein
MLMKRLAMIAFLTFGLASPTIAADSQATSPASGTPDPTSAKKPSAVTHFDFEDDRVEGDLQRPDGELISSVPKARQQSLIEIRKDFIPEILKMIEDL